MMRFIADRMLGRLCVWLRILGYDTIYAGSAQVQQRIREMRDCGMNDLEMNDRKMKNGKMNDGDDRVSSECHDAEDKFILDLAMKEHRILLTRDKRLAGDARKRGVMCILVRGDDIDEQLRELASSTDLNLEPVAERCSECNAPIRLVRDEEIEELLMTKEYVPKALIRRKDFWICEGCGRIYWEGSHWREIRKRLERIKKSGGDREHRDGTGCDRRHI